MKTLPLKPGTSSKWFHEFVTGYATVCMTDACKNIKMPSANYVLNFHGAFRFSSDIYEEEKRRLGYRGIKSPTWCKGVAVAKTILFQKRGLL